MPNPTLVVHRNPQDLEGNQSFCKHMEQSIMNARKSCESDVLVRRLNENRRFCEGPRRLLDRDFLRA